MDDKNCGNCGWDGKTPLDSGIPKGPPYGAWEKFMAENDPKMAENAQVCGEKAMYKQDGEDHSKKDEEACESWDGDCGEDSCDGDDGGNCGLRGCLIFYIDVGQLPPFKAEAFVQKMKDQLDDKGGLKRIKFDHEVFFVPVRNGLGTRVKYIAFN